MPIQANTAPVVQLPVTGIDPTAAAAPAVVPASPTGVQLPTVQTPTLSDADRALIEQTRQQFAKPTDAAPVPASTGGPTFEAAGPAEGVLYQGNDANASDASASPTPTTEGGASSAAAGEGGAASGEDKPAVELTPSQKLAAKIASKKAQVVKLNDEIERLEGQFRSVDLLDKIKPSSIIVARVGRAETSREVDATVLGVQTLPNGDLRYKVYFGEGFEAETVVIQSSQIVDVKQV